MGVVPLICEAPPIVAVDVSEAVKVATSALRFVPLATVSPMVLEPIVVEPTSPGTVKAVIALALEGATLIVTV